MTTTLMALEDSVTTAIVIVIVRRRSSATEAVFNHSAYNGRKPRAGPIMLGSEPVEESS